MMQAVSTHLLDREQTAIYSFTQSLSTFLGDDLCGLWLFGSKARGDFDPDSDVDLLIVLGNLTFERRGKIRRLAARISLDFDTLINTHLIERSRWEKMATYQDTLWREVERDGVPILLPVMMT